MKMRRPSSPASLEVGDMPQDRYVISFYPIRLSSMSVWFGSKWLEEESFKQFFFAERVGVAGSEDIGDSSIL